MGRNQPGWNPGRNQPEQNHLEQNQAGRNQVARDPGRSQAGGTDAQRVIGHPRAREACVDVGGDAS